MAAVTWSWHSTPPLSSLPGKAMRNPAPAKVRWSNFGDGRYLQSLDGHRRRSCSFPTSTISSIRPPRNMWVVQLQPSISRNLMLRLCCFGLQNLKPSNQTCSYWIKSGERTQLALKWENWRPYRKLSYFYLLLQTFLARKEWLWMRVSSLQCYRGCLMRSSWHLVGCQSVQPNCRATKMLKSFCFTYKFDNE